MQHASDRDGQCSGYPLRVILLQARNGLAYVVGENAVNRPAIISEPCQIALQRAHVSRLRDQLSPGLEPVERTPRSSGEIRLSQAPALMRQSQIVPRRQATGGMKKRSFVVYRFYDLRAGSPATMHQIF